MKKNKILAIIVFLLFTLGVSISQYTGSMYKGITVFTFISLLTIYLLSKSRINYIYIILTIISISILFRIVVFNFPATLSGIDPHDYVIWIEQTVESGSTLDTTIIGFYSIASIYIIFISVASLLTNLSADVSFVAVIVASGILLPCLTYVIVKQFYKYHDRTVTTVTVLIVVFMPYTVLSSYRPIAQTLAGLYFLTFAYMILKCRDGISVRTGIITLLLIISLAAVHKLSLFFVASGLLSILALYSIMVIRFSDKSSHVSLFAVLGSIVIIVLYVQLEQTGYTTAAVYRSIGYIGEGSTTVNQVTGAIPGGFYPYTGYHYSFYSMLLLFTGAVGCLVNFVLYRENLQYHILVGFSIAIGLVTVGGVISGQLGFNRLLDYGGILLIVTFTMSIISLNRKCNISVSNEKIATIILILFLITALFTPVISPDFPGYHREYLTQDEYSAIEFADNSIHNTIKADWYASRVGSPHHTAPRHTSAHYEPFEEAILNRELPNSEYILYRHSIDVFHSAALNSPEAFYKLNWEPENQLNYSRNKIYSSGTGASIYTK